MRLKNMRGFTALEVAVSASILLLTLLVGAMVSKTAMLSTKESVKQSESDRSIQRVVDAIERHVRSACAMKLEATPSKEGSVPEPMLDGVSYDNIRFRSPASFADGKVIYDPPEGTTPYSIHFEKTQRDSSATGEIVFELGENGTSTHSGVQSVTFLRNGSLLSISVTMSTVNDPEPHTEVRFLRLRTY